ncbi:MAG: sensor histidine kinase, partial [Ignavibacteriales bacterium]
MSFDGEEIGTPKKIIITILMLVIIILLDSITGNELSFSIFYLIPIIFAGWFLNRNYGIAVSVLGAGLWLISELLNKDMYTHNLVPYWNALARLGIFLCITYLINLVKSIRERERDIIHYIVHDLRSPLASILTGIKMLIEEDQPLTKREKQIIDLSIGTGNNMMMVINSILDLGRLEKKKMPINITQIDIPRILNETADQFRLTAELNRTEIKIICLHDKIKSDEILLRRILVNLLNNAIKFTEENTVVTLTAEKTDKGKIKFSISDQGMGIPDDMKMRLFS